MSRRSPVLAAAAAAALSLSLSCATTRIRPVAPPVPYQGFFAKFPTGLRLMVYERPALDRVLVGVSYLAGAVDEPKGKEGIAHLAEHISYRARSGPARIWDRLLGAGVVFNGRTTHDATVYWEIGKPDQLDVALAAEVARMRDPLAGVTQADLDREREVVLSELREREGLQPEVLGLQALAERAFGRDHPYARRVLGTEASLRAITLDDLRAWFRERYAPDHAVMVVVGPGPAKATAAGILELFGDLAEGSGGPERKPAVRELPPLPADPPAEMVVIRAPVSKPILLLGWTTPGEISGTTPLALAGKAALQGALAARMSAEDLRDRVEGLWVQVFRHDAQHLVVVTVELADEKDANRVLESAKDQLVGLIGVRLSALIGIRLRDHLLTQAFLDMESLDAPAITRWIRTADKPDYLGGWQAEIAVKLSSVPNSYFFENLKRGRTAAVLVAPDPAGRARLLEVPREGVAVTREEHDDRPDPVAPTRPLEDLARGPGLDLAQRAVLSNGLGVVIARRGSLPIVDVRLAFRTDAAGASGSSGAIPAFALAMHGAASDFRWQHASRIGANQWIVAENDAVVIGERGGSGNLDQILEDVARWPRSFTVSAKRMRSARLAFARMAATAERDPVPRAERALHETLFPGHAYGRFPTAAEIEKVADDEVETWIRGQMLPRRATLIVTGDVQPGPELLARIESRFGGWHGDGAVAPMPEAPAPAERKVLLVDQPGAKQALVLVGLRIPHASRRDRAAEEALRWRIETTLNESLRVAGGLTYGVHVARLDRRAGAALVIETAVDAGATGQAVARILAMLDAFAAAPPPARVAERARWQVARRFAFRFDTIREAAAAIQQTAILDLAPDHFERLGDSLLTLGPERLHAAARAMVGREVVVVVGDAGVIRKQLKDEAFEPELVAAAPGSQ
jgi:zinc protease